MGEDNGQTSALALFRPWYLVVLLLLAAIVPYLPGMKGPFLFDDVHNIKENAAVYSFEPGRFFADPTTFSAKTGNWPYRPLTVTVNSILAVADADSALAWHIVALALHLFSTFLVFLLCVRGFRLGKTAFVPAFIFAAAPLQTQAVLYVSALGVVLSCFFSLSAVWFFICLSDRQDKSAVFATLVVLFSIVAFFSYEGSLALLVWLPLALYGGNRPIISKKTVVVFVGVFFCAVLYLALRAGFAPGEMFSGHRDIRPEYSAFEQVMNGLELPWVMAGILLFPKGLNFFHHPAPPSSIFSASAIMIFAATVLVFVFLFMTRKRRPLAAGTAWYLAALLPAALVSLNLPWSEHRAYLALPGLAIALGYAFTRLLENLGPLRRRGAYLLIVLMFFCFALFTVLRADAWTSEAKIMKDAVKKSPRYDVPWHILASRYQGQGDCARAIRLEQRAVSVNPDFADAYNTMASCYLVEGQLKKARQAAGKALELDRHNPMYKRNLAVVLIYTGEKNRAERMLRELVESLPRHDYVRRLAERDLAGIGD